MKNTQENKPKWVIASFSGGKDSSAMVLRKIELGEHIDEVIFCDTYKEFPAMYRHIEKVKRVIEDAGIKFTILKSEKTFDYLMFEYTTTRGKHQDKVGKGWATPLVRWCTAYLKRDVIREYKKTLNSCYDVVECVGIAADEIYRLNRDTQKQSHKIHPLVEWGWTEKDCLEYCYDKGYNWEGLYEIFDRVSCWCCPLKSFEEYRKLRMHFPELWQELKDMDERTWNKFMKNYSVADLEKRFEFEEERAAQGLSIRNKDFYTQLKARL